MPIQFPAVIELSSLDGSNGFQLNGASHDGSSGVSVNAAGDINHDGVDDLIIGAYKVPYGTGPGRSYLVFGGAHIAHSGVFWLGGLNGNNGFTLNGIAAGDYSGYSVSAVGDINHDGVADLIVGAYGANPNGSSSGQSYVVFGGANVGRNGLIELSNLNGSNGFKLNGIATNDYSGRSVSAAGDINHDGIADLIIGANGVDRTVNVTNIGQSYVVFGKTDVGNSGTFELSSLNGSNGFKLNGIAAGDNSGRSVSVAGDINADGVADLIIGAYNADPNGSGSGQSYVVFGALGVGGSGVLELSDLNGSNGFKINGIGVGDSSGISVSAAGDINGDGVDDLIIGAYRAPNQSYLGESYVIFGGLGVGSGGTFELASLDGSNGFKLNKGGDYSGYSVSSAGDINADGVADLIIGAYKASPNGRSSGQSYVIFGSAGIGSDGVLKLSSLNGSNGVTLNGIARSDYSGISVSAAGDINHDGVDDLIIGAFAADPTANTYGAGESYVVFGDSLQLSRNQLTITKGQTAILSVNNLKATSINHNGALLQFQITATQQGQFEFISNPNIAITSFYQQNITDNQVQFVHNGSDNPPAYQVNAFTDMWARTGPEAATINFTPILLVHNAISINQGGTQVLSSADLSATDSAAPDNTLLFTVSNLQHGHFEKVDTLDIAITSFIQQDITNQAIQFIQDSSPNVPGYSIMVSDGLYTLPPTAAIVTFNYSPVLETNNLSIVQGQQLSLSPNNLKASDPETPAKELLFSISALQNGQFELASNAGAPITQFTQGQVDLGTVQFIHNGSPNAPSYNVTVSDNAITTTPNTAIINWNPTPASKADRTVRNTLLGTFLPVGVIGTLLLCYMSMGFLQKRRLKAAGQRGNEEQAHFYKTAIIPIAQAVFKQIKVTGFMNYISTNQMEAYVAEIATVVNEINQLGINIELQEMNPDHQTQLLNQIVKQMKRHLGIQSGMCNRAWFTTFFKPQVKPEMIGQKAKLIASSVHAALMGNPDDRFEEIEMPTVRLLAGDERRDSMNSEGSIQNPMAEVVRLQNLLEERDNNIQQRDMEIERLRELLNQQASDGSFNSTTSYVKLA